MEKNTITQNLATIIGNVCGWFLSAAFILWGWSVIAPHLNAPLFNYWEIFAMRVALGSVVAMFRSKK